MRERFPSLEADDIIQETLFALCKVLPSYRYAPDEKGHFHNYLLGVVRHKAVDAVRRNASEDRKRKGFADAPKAGKEQGDETKW